MYMPHPSREWALVLFLPQPITLVSLNFHSSPTRPCLPYMTIVGVGVIEITNIGRLPSSAPSFLDEYWVQTGIVAVGTVRTVRTYIRWAFCLCHSGLKRKGSRGGSRVCIIELLQLSLCFYLILPTIQWVGINISSPCSDEETEGFLFFCATTLNGG